MYSAVECYITVKTSDTELHATPAVDDIPNTNLNQKVDCLQYYTTYGVFKLCKTKHYMIKDT